MTQKEIFKYLTEEREIEVERAKLLAQLAVNTKRTTKEEVDKVVEEQKNCCLFDIFLDCFYLMGGSSC